VDTALLGVAMVIAILVIRTAVHELREPGSGRRQWGFLHDRRAVTAGATAGFLLGLAGWGTAGAAHVPWVILVGTLVAASVASAGRK